MIHHRNDISSAVYREYDESVLERCGVSFKYGCPTMTIHQDLHVELGKRESLKERE